MPTSGFFRLWVQKKGKRVWYSAMLDYQNERGHWITENLDPDLVKRFLSLEKTASLTIPIEEAPLPKPLERALNELFNPERPPTKAD